MFFMFIFLQKKSRIMQYIYYVSLVSINLKEFPSLFFFVF